MAVVQAFRALIDIHANNAVAEIALEASARVIRLRVVACCSGWMAVVHSGLALVNVDARRSFPVRHVSLPSDRDGCTVGRVGA